MAKEKSGIHQELKPSKELAAVIGDSKISRGGALKAVWKYIKKNELQNPKNGREILCDSKLKAVMGHSTINMMKMGGKIFKSLT